MRSRSLPFALPLAALLAAAASTQIPAPVKFAPPLRLKAGDKFLGENRLFPSPVFHDVDGDGRLDIVTGDLMGRLTVALRLPDQDHHAVYAAETKLKDEDGKEIDFHNW